MAANNMVNPAVDPNLEDELFAKEVEEVKKWWSDSRWRHTKRPFTAEQIVNKRGNLKIEYASNAQAKKLWQILERRFQVGSSIHSVSDGKASMADLIGTVTDTGRQLHLRVLRAHNGHADGQVSRHGLRLGLAVVIHCLVVR
jgi:isocitrate lyase